MANRMERPVGLEEILEAKEKRAGIQRQLREEYGCAVVSISVNMPGSVKYSADVVDLLYFAVAELRQTLHDAAYPVREERVCHSVAGPYAVLAVESDAAALKQMGMRLEETSAFGRLLDIDVFDGEGKQISRAGLGLTERLCLVCPEPAVLCVRTRAHSPEAVLAAVKRRIQAFRSARTQAWPTAVELIGTGAVEAMLMEVSCSPAPGLVDRFNSGAHSDMDFFTFIESSSALYVAMHRCAMAGWQHEGEEAAELLPLLRQIGMEGEKAMFAATGGVNTQKGLLFLMGIVAAAAALVLRRHGGVPATGEAILKQAAAICAGIVERELLPLRTNRPGRKLTAGERLFLEHGVTGVRGEIEQGMPVVVGCGLPAYRTALAAGFSVNDALVHALLALMTAAYDTTILHRHDMATLQAVQAQAKEIMAAGGMMSDLGREQIHLLDKQFSARRISPGGSADLLAITYFLDFFERRVRQ